MKPGDVVCLKSGGQRMTVERLLKLPESTPAWSVTWMHSANIFRDHFPESALLLLEDGDAVRPESPEAEYKRSRPVATRIPGAGT